MIRFKFYQLSKGNCNGNLQELLGIVCAQVQNWSYFYVENLADLKLILQTKVDKLNLLNSLDDVTDINL